MSEAADQAGARAAGGWRRAIGWRLIGPIVVVAAIGWAGPAEVWATLRGADLRLVAVALALAVPMALLKAARWHTLLRGQGVSIRFRESASMYTMGMLMAAVTPGRAGDFVKILLLMDRGLGLGRAVAYNVFDRMFDIAFIFLAGYAGMGYFSRHLGDQLWIAHVVMGAGVAAGVVFVLRHGQIRGLALRLVPERHRDAAGEVWDEMVHQSVGRLIRRAGVLSAWSLAFWPLYFAAGWLCARAVDVDVPFLYLSACIAVATIISFVPITVAGAGTRDAVFIVLLGQIGIARHESVAASSLILVVFLCNCVVFYAMSVLLQPRGVRRDERHNAKTSTRQEVGGRG